MEKKSDLNLSNNKKKRKRKLRKVVKSWTKEEVGEWLEKKGHSINIIQNFINEGIDGKGLLLLTEEDLKNGCHLQIKLLGDLKRLFFDILQLQSNFFNKRNSHHHHHPLESILNSPSTKCKKLSFSKSDSFSDSEESSVFFTSDFEGNISNAEEEILGDGLDSAEEESDKKKNRKKKIHSNGHHHVVTGYATNLEPEVWKALVAMAYVFCVTWITALVMVIVHDRVPDMEKYPPLPDLFLDNMPHIPWAFEMCEVTGTILFLLFCCVLFFHKHRFILLRRFFALSGTVFLLRCVTMLITSLSVPGTHLQCNPRAMPYGDWLSRLYNAYLIWKGAGMSIQGVRTCGDYMFSGHTVALTMLNFFVTEYTTRRLYFVHTFSWLLNMFGIFFILAAHEHYSIDVFIAFYITSRLFLYYHTLANNQALMQRDSKRTKVWFPLFSYFESDVNGIVPNHYEWPLTYKRMKNFTLELMTQVHRHFFNFLRDCNNSNLIKFRFNKYPLLFRTNAPPSFKHGHGSTKSKKN